MKFSVIIPVYKAEYTLRRCVDSLINQNRSDAEIILINDGSPDSSGEICKEYAELYNQVKYIEKENGGVSTARNAGLSVATGEYILFVDSDDWIETDSYEHLLGLMEKYQVKLVCGGNYNVSIQICIVCIAHLILIEAEHGVPCFACNRSNDFEAIKSNITLCKCACRVECKAKLKLNILCLLVKCQGLNVYIIATYK